MEKSDQIVDYAYPCMMAEKALADLHKRVLENNFDASIEAGLLAISELRIAVASLKVMKEKYIG